MFLSFKIYFFMSLSSTIVHLSTPLSPHLPTLHLCLLATCISLSIQTTSTSSIPPKTSKQKSPNHHTPLTPTLLLSQPLPLPKPNPTLPTHTRCGNATNAEQTTTTTWSAATTAATAAVRDALTIPLSVSVSLLLLISKPPIVQSSITLLDKG